MTFKEKVMKLKSMGIAVTALALVFGAITPAASAECSMGGCNIIDDGTFYSLRPGDVVYDEVSTTEQKRYSVVQVDRSRNIVIGRDAFGKTKRLAGSNLYTANRVEERSVAKTIIGVGVLLALIAASGSGSGSSSSSGGEESEAERASKEQSGNNPHGSAVYGQHSGNGCFWGTGEDGTCIN